MSLQQLGWPLHFVQNVMRMSRKLEERNKKWSWFWRDTVISERNWTCLFFSYTWPRAQKVRSQPTIGAHIVQSKQVGLDSFSLAGLPIAIGKKWEFIRGTQNTHKQLSVGDCLQMRFGQELSKVRGTKGWCCKKTTYNPWHHWWTPLQDRPK